MKRVALFAGSLLLLASCAPQAGLPQEQVLENAIRAAQELLSVRFTLNGNIEGSTPLGEKADLVVTANGWTQQERKQLQTSFGLDGSVNGQSLQLNADIIVAGENDVYVQVKNVSSEDPASPLRSPFFNLIVNQWWHLPSAEYTAGGVTPDPRLLELQMQSVDITRNRGMEEVNGSMSYHYDLEINNEKLLHFLEEVARERKEEFDAEEWKKSFADVKTSGSAWIDADTFQLNRLEWTIENSKEDDNWNIVFDVTFADHNKAPVILPPAKAKEMESLPDMLSNAMMQSSPSGATGMPSDMQRELLESLLDPR